MPVPEGFRVTEADTMSYRSAAARTFSSVSPRTRRRSRYISHSLGTAFSDAPRAEEGNVCENLYLKIIYNAKKYVYINTPYLILDGEMKRALITAARAGVDVRITIPAIPDKKYVYSVTKAFSFQLLKEGQ